MDLAKFETLLRETIGLDTASIGTSLIVRAIEARMAACNLDDQDAYREYLRVSESELQQLVESVVINETWFFRQPEAYVALTRFACDEWLPTHPLGVLRLLSLPCSTGEEPYSMAMALLDAGFPPDRFRIDAVDISVVALARAERAIYNKNSFRTKDLSFRERYFELTANGYCPADSVRERVRFLQGNLFDPDFMPGTEFFDVIFCRNVLIYFDRANQDFSLQVLTRLLKRDGLLFVGHSETSRLVEHNYVSVKFPLAFAFRKLGTEAGKKTGPVAASAKFEPKTMPLPIPPRPKPSAVASLPLIPSSSLTPPPAGPPQIKKVTLEEAQRLADQGQLIEAARCCEDYLRDHGPGPDAFYLLGLIRDAAGQRGEAITYYRKAIYLAPRHQEALIHLALLLKEQGDVAGAKVINDRIVRLESGSER